MAKKGNIRSIRFSDEIAELIDRQIGDTFTAKFENLVIRCVWELPGKEEQLAQLEAEIGKKREQLRQMSAQAGELGATINELFPKVRALEEGINRAARKWEA